MSSPTHTKKARSVRGMSLGFKALFWFLVVWLPLLGVWIGSSLAAFQNGPTWVAIAAGALAFPVLPLAWEGLRAYRRRAKTRQGKAPKRAILTFGDRLILRTLVINTVFLGVLFLWFPTNVFTALSTRGDWLLDGTSAPWANSTRRVLFAAADRMEWLWELTHENQFSDEDGHDDKSDDGNDHSPSPQPSERPKPTEQPTRKPTAKPTPNDAPPGAPKRWPFEATPHPAVLNLPSEAEESIDSVAQYLESKEADPFLLTKALHDYVADRISYDVPSYRAGRYPPQDAESIFAARTGVCAGYARLLQALGEKAGLEILYLVGQSRDMGGNVGGQGHAWNAVKLDGAWYLLDATWDAGYVNGDTFTKRYSSDYFLAPPEVFGLNHYPEDDEWQLRQTPISRGDFMRQPNVRPYLYSSGFELVSPSRSQVTVNDGAFRTQLKNNGTHWLNIYWSEKGSDDRTGDGCKVEQGADTIASCDLPGRGTYLVSLFVGEEQYGTSWYAGQFEVNQR